jgi:catechol 2,3-dioxygenase-like lactoylglutathione lyase family enzyme
MIEVDRIDHVVLTVNDIERTVDFYIGILGMQVERFGEGRTALRFGNQKINLHQVGHEFEPKANHPTPSSADLCFIAPTAMDEVTRFLCAQGVAIESGPAQKAGATGPIVSVYFRDPDYNLVEVSNYLVSSQL